MERFVAEYAEKAKYSMANRPTQVRPVRVRVINELGNGQTLPDDAGQFELLPGGPDTVFLGLGPTPAALSGHFPAITRAAYVECPDMIAQISGWESSVPAGFSRLAPESFTPERAAAATVIRYRPGLKAFPSFFAPLAARAALAKEGGQNHAASSVKTVWIPSTERDLLGRELRLAFESRGWRVRIMDPDPLERSPGTELPRLLDQGVPELFLSVNFRGLEPFGLGQSILREAGTTVAVWMVDNPFHLLTGVKTASWRHAKLFVSDHSFIGPLTENGARWVHHLPLAASPELFATPGPLPENARDLADRLVFVGRSKFPKKQQYFAGLTPDAALMREATTMLDHGQRPDFHWWRARVPAPLWPGNEVRRVGIGAEVAGRAWRTRCLGEAGPQAVIFGDDAWKHTPGITADVRPVIDYYTALPAVYRAAGAVLNVTGMQLPAGLTQRHFDVWCTDGLLLTDANPGLAIFPGELTAPVTFTVPDEIMPLFANSRADKNKTQALRHAWQELLLAEHTYAHRVDTILTRLCL